MRVILVNFGYFWIFLGIFGYFWVFFIILGIFGYFGYDIVLYRIDIVSILYRYCIDIVSIHIARPWRVGGTFLTFLTIFDHVFTGTHVFTLLFVISRRTRLLPSWACFQ